MDNTQNIISLCSGYAGLDRAIELAGVKTRTVAYVEIEAFAIANLVAKMETGLLVPAPVWTNLKTFPMEAFRGRIHGITAGYPCQPFSCAGQRKGTDDPRHLWPFIQRIYQTIQPGWMFFENVEGHVTLGLSTVISDLEEDGYRVKAGLFTAAEVGAPHKRKRVFILANARGIHTARSNKNRTDERRVCELSREQAVRSENIGCGDGNAVADPISINGTRWPSRPGQPQYEWEEPRVTQPGLGRNVDGSSSRVDRLRLLGNGVVPQQAAKAFIILNSRHEEL